MNKVIDYKSDFRIVLTPIMELFEYKKTKLDESEWIRFVESTKLSIISNPQQFLGNDLPNPQLIQKAVLEIFEEFMEDHKMATV